MTNKRHLSYLIAGAVGLAAFGIYLAALRNGFVLWDDDVLVTDNPHIRALNWAFLKWAFTDVSVAVYWHPLTWISHAVDYALWGMNPLGHHLTSILLHGIDTFLVVLLVVRLFEAANALRAGRGVPPLLDGRSILIAAGVTGVLFGIHPLHVESVAWISERRDLLYAFFFLLSIIAYLGYALRRESRPASGAFIRDGRYLLSLSLFGLSLASKPMAVTLPAVLLILDWHPLDRIRTRTDLVRRIAEKLPFLALSLAASISTVIAQKAAGAMPALDVVPLPSRLLVATWSLVMYLVKMAVPLRLSPVYPYPKSVPLLSFEYLVPLALVVAITAAACLLAAKRQKAWLALWGYFVVSLLPVLGILQIGYQSMADRFTYLPSLGPFLLAGLAGARIWAWTDGPPARSKARRTIIGMAAAAAVCLAFLTVRQTAVWKDTVTFWSYVISQEPTRVPNAYINRGVAFAERNEPERAFEDFNQAIALDPVSPYAYNNRGRVYFDLGMDEAALADFTTAIDQDPRYYIAYNNRGLALQRLGRPGRALEDYSTAITLRPDYVSALTNRGMVYSDRGEQDRAINDFSAAIEADPSYRDAYIARGMAFTGQGRYGEAVSDLDRAIELDPSNVDAFLDRGVAFERSGRLDRALSDYGRAIELDPSDPLAYSGRGAVLGKLGRYGDAVADLTKAILLDPQDAESHMERGRIYQASGDHGRAAADYRKACTIGSGAGCSALRAVNARDPQLRPR